MSENDISQRPSSFFLENFLTGLEDATLLSTEADSVAGEVNDSADACIVYDAPRVGWVDCFDA